MANPVILDNVVRRFRVNEELSAEEQAELLRQQKSLQKKKSKLDLEQTVALAYYDRSFADAAAQQISKNRKKNPDHKKHQRKVDESVMALSGRHNDDLTVAISLAAIENKKDFFSNLDTPYLLDRYVLKEGIKAATAIRNFEYILENRARLIPELLENKENTTKARSIIEKDKNASEIVINHFKRRPIELSMDLVVRTINAGMLNIVLNPSLADWLSAKFTFSKVNAEYVNGTQLVLRIVDHKKPPRNLIRSFVETRWIGKEFWRDVKEESDWQLLLGYLKQHLGLKDQLYKDAVARYETVMGKKFVLADSHPDKKPDDRKPEPPSASVSVKTVVSTLTAAPRTNWSQSFIPEDRGTSPEEMADIENKRKLAAERHEKSRAEQLAATQAKLEAEKQARIAHEAERLRLAAAEAEQQAKLVAQARNEPAAIDLVVMPTTPATPDRSYVSSIASSPASHLPSPVSYVASPDGEAAGENLASYVDDSDHKGDAQQKSFIETVVNDGRVPPAVQPDAQLASYVATEHQGAKKDKQRADDGKSYVESERSFVSTPEEKALRSFISTDKSFLETSTPQRAAPAYLGTPTSQCVSPIDFEEFPDDVFDIDDEEFEGTQQERERAHAIFGKKKSSTATSASPTGIAGLNIAATTGAGAEGITLAALQEALSHVLPKSDDQLSHLPSDDKVDTNDPLIDSALNARCADSLVNKNNDYVLPPVKRGGGRPSERLRNIKKETKSENEPPVSNLSTPSKSQVAPGSPIHKAHEDAQRLSRIPLTPNNQIPHSPSSNRVIRTTS